MQKLRQSIKNMFAGLRRKNIPTNNHAKCGFILRHKMPLVEDQEQNKES